MHILHISSAKTWRGGEQQIAYLIEELHSQGITQSVYGVEDAPFAQWCQEKDISCFTYQKRSSIDPRIAKQLKSIVQQEKVTHVHAHDSHAHTFAFLAALLFNMKVPIIVSRRVDFPIKNSFFSRWKYNHASIRKIICISKRIAQVISATIKDKNRLTVIHSGIRADKFQTKNQNLLHREFQLPHSKKIVANIAALADHKDYPTFVRTAEILLKRRDDLQFLIIGGDAGEETNIRQIIKEKGLENAIVLTGHRSDIATIFPELAILLFTSKEEGLGTTVLDAFAAKVPVVATNGGGIPEMIIHEKTGWLSPIGDAEHLAMGVEKFLDEEELRGKIIENATNQLENFSTKKMAAAILKVYHTVS